MISPVYQIPEKPLHSGRPVRIICIGAGASGLLLAYKVKYNFDEKDVEIQVYEKNKDLGGTWLENRYPGCACDCPAHTYTWSFEPKTDWSQAYATSPEIYEYFRDFAQKYDLEKYIQYESPVTGATWDADSGKWLVEMTTPAGKKEDSCDILINAGGILNAWRWPAIPGLDSFAGPKLHSANWDQSLDLTDKKIGLIGNGSSGIQILPTILPQVKHAVNFIREPAWISPIILPGFEARKFDEQEKQEFQQNPDKHLQYRRSIESSGNAIFPLFLTESQQQQQAMSFFSQSMKDQIPDPYLRQKLVPEWSVGCRRLTPGTGYLKALSDPKSSVVYGEITRIGPKGPVTEDGKEHPIDVLVCATGFDTSFKPRFPLRGSGGILLSEKWENNPKAYLGMGAPGFPNYFMFLGPNCPIGNGPVLIGIEAQADYFMKFIKKFREENIKSFTPTEEAVEEFTRHKDVWMKRSVWDKDCRSWYKNSSGTVTAVWPGSVPHYIELLERPRFEDYGWEYTDPSNRWSFLGNGFSQRETLGADLAWYIRQADDAIPLGKNERFASTLKKTK
ncbi:uncharacterized protein Z518_04681 [Rhinocladiella mackenziei CBS 650.93]|uniref:Uncharacterized protein n=1 Tax=Rhinocladiella mackenziei CBS 650.93 TaxID=1442369 RepID=A0A0D2JC84_9EURO|nr:uncharacterized protein Z518_04681 [Rhinocladiella mackenziei CBS 650.93]KIX06705.1 hypothetical protein Z518_04681 [Rhinocladiella mackenziei CBS 650.93]